MQKDSPVSTEDHRITTARSTLEASERTAVGSLTHVELCHLVGRLEAVLTGVLEASER